MGKKRSHHKVWRAQPSQQQFTVLTSSKVQANVEQHGTNDIHWLELWGPPKGRLCPLPFTLHVIGAGQLNMKPLHCRNAHSAHPDNWQSCCSNKHGEQRRCYLSINEVASTHTSSDLLRWWWFGNTAGKEATQLISDSTVLELLWNVCVMSLRGGRPAPPLIIQENIHAH